MKYYVVVNDLAVSLVLTIFLVVGPRNLTWFMTGEVGCGHVMATINSLSKDKKCGCKLNEQLYGQVC